MFVIGITILYIIAALATSIPLTREELEWIVQENGEVKARLRRDDVYETALGFIFCASMGWPITWTISAVYYLWIGLNKLAPTKRLWFGNPPAEIQEKRLDKLLEPTKVD